MTMRDLSKRRLITTCGVLVLTALALAISAARWKTPAHAEPQAPAPADASQAPAVTTTPEPAWPAISTPTQRLMALTIPAAPINAPTVPRQLAAATVTRSTGARAADPKAAFARPSAAQMRDQPAAQTAAQVLSQRLELSNPTIKKEVSGLLRESAELRRIAAREKAEQMGLPTFGQKQNGGTFVLDDFEHGGPVYKATENVNAAISTATDQVRQKPAYDNVNGSGLRVGVWDEPGLRGTHREFGSRRLEVVDGSTSINGSGDHATHVTATIAAAGIDPLLKGMAPAVAVEFYDFNSELAEMTESGASLSTDNKLLVGNGSYGRLMGWSRTDSHGWLWHGVFVADETSANDYEDDFGKYDEQTVALDGVAYNAPWFLIVRSAGNDRDEGPPPDGTQFTHAGTGTVYTYNDLSDPHGDGEYADGFDTIGADKIGKNILTVGAVTDAVAGGTRNVAAAQMTSFSSWGPADDGRIKPDLVANGEDVLSASSASDAGSAVREGTSMASANVSGSAILLQQYYTNYDENGAPMRADMLKGLIIHTADDLGHAGPDYQFGWGLMNTKAAADVITAHFDGRNGAVLHSGEIKEGEPETIRFGWDGSTPLRVTLCWTDVPNLAANAHNERSPDLVNDLDLVVTGPGGTVVLPYTTPFQLGTGDAAQPAVRGANHRDNIEQVHLPAAELTPGIYTITIAHTSDLVGGTQAFALVVTGNVPPPDIGVTLDNRHELVSKSSRADFGYMVVGEVSERTFTLRNDGQSAALTNIVASIEPSEASDFVLVSAPAAALAPYEETSFTVAFNPTRAGLSKATLRIASNDPFDNPFTVQLTGFSEVEGNGSVGWARLQDNSHELAFDRAGNVITANGKKFANGDGAFIWEVSEQPQQPDRYGHFIGVDVDDHIFAFRFASGVGLTKYDGATGVLTPGPYGPLQIRSPFRAHDWTDSAGNQFGSGNPGGGPRNQFTMYKVSAASPDNILWSEDIFVSGGDEAWISSQSVNVVDAVGDLISAWSSATLTVLEHTETEYLTRTDQRWFLTKRSGADGAFLWQKEVAFEYHFNTDSAWAPHQSHQRPHQLLIDPDGSILFARQAPVYDWETHQRGERRGPLVLSKHNGETGDVEWVVESGSRDVLDEHWLRYGAGAAALDEDGNFFVTFDRFTQKYSNRDGALLWETELPAVSGCLAYGFDDHLAVGGYNERPDGLDMNVTIKLNGSTGAIEWTRGYDFPLTEGYGNLGLPDEIAADNRGNVAILAADSTLIVYPATGSVLSVECTAPPLAVREGDNAQASGTFSSSIGLDAVTLKATKNDLPYGTIVKDAAAGKWTWSRITADGPDESGTVVITADDGVGTPVTTSFNLPVLNVAPSFNLGDIALTPAEASSFSRTVTFVDPGAEVWSGTVSYGDGTANETLAVNQGAKSFSLSHAFSAPGVYSVNVMLTDGDPGGSVSRSFKVTVQRRIQDWRLEHFGTAENTGDAADLADIERDGLANLLEFAFDLDPTKPDAAELPQPTLTGSSLSADAGAPSLRRAAGKTMTYSFTEPPGIVGVTYGADYSTNLATWTSIADTGSAGTHIFSVDVGSHPKLFMRLRVTSSP